MKAQRRHDLQQSDLAKVIKQAPGFWQQAGGRWALLAIVVLVVAVLIRYRIVSNREVHASALGELATARYLIAEMDTPQQRLLAVLGAPAQASVQRKQLFNDATLAIAKATERTDDRQIAAEALIARGDLNWLMANLPQIPGATTQPSLQFRDRKEFIANASEAYKAIVDNFADLKHAQITARFGLAAIAEDRGEWDAARQQYGTIAAQTNDIGAYQQLAAERLRLLGRISQPVILGKPATEPSPATAPAGPSGPPAPKPATTNATRR